MLCVFLLIGGRGGAPFRIVRARILLDRGSFIHVFLLFSIKFDIFGPLKIEVSRKKIDKIVDR